MINLLDPPRGYIEKGTRLALLGNKVARGKREAAERHLVVGKMKNDSIIILKKNGNAAPI